MKIIQYNKRTYNKIGLQKVRNDDNNNKSL